MEKPKPNIHPTSLEEALALLKAAEKPIQPLARRLEEAFPEKKVKAS